MRKRTETATFDLIVLKDGIGILDADLRSSERTARSTLSTSPSPCPRALAAATRRIGLVATPSTGITGKLATARL